MSPERGARRWRTALTSGGAALGAVLAPKCPLCVAAALSACGLGIGMTAAGLFAILLRPVAAVVAIGALAATIWPLVHRHVRPMPEATGPHGDCAACDHPSRPNALPKLSSRTSVSSAHPSPRDADARSDRT
jgi:hypothetical protein